MSLFQGSFRGISFPLENTCEASEWRYQTHEYITAHLPQTERYAKSPEELTIDGFLLGRDALLTKDLLAKACEQSSPGLLLHPLYGLRTVICLSMKFETFDDSMNSFRFHLLFKEILNAPGLGGLLGKALSIVEKAHGVINDYAMKFLTEMSFISLSAYTLERGVGLLKKIDGFLVSRNGFGIFAASTEEVTKQKDTVYDLSVHLIKTPKELIERIIRSVAGFLSVHESLDFLEFIQHQEGDHKDSPTSKILFACSILAVAHDAAAEKITAEYLESVNFLLDKATDDEIFSFLWDLKISMDQQIIEQKAKADEVTVTNIEKIPSLVRSYLLYGNLEQAEGLAQKHGQPFAI